MAGSSSNVGAPKPTYSKRAVQAGATHIANGTFAATYGSGGAAIDFSSTLFYEKLQSVSVACIAGDVPTGANAVKIEGYGLLSTIFLNTGQTVTWSVAQDSGDTDEYLASPLKITCQGDSAALVTWTTYT